MAIFIIIWDSPGTYKKNDVNRNGDIKAIWEKEC